MQEKLLHGAVQVGLFARERSVAGFSGFWFRRVVIYPLLDCPNPTAHDLGVLYATKGLHDDFGRPFKRIMVYFENV